MGFLIQSIKIHPPFASALQIDTQGVQIQYRSAVLKN
jgi:hypothetical protein